MLHVEFKNNTAVIDVRENIARGEHPRNQVLDYIKQAPIGTIIEIHLPFMAEPLLAAISSLGLNVSVSELGQNHFRFIIVKLVEL